MILLRPICWLLGHKRGTFVRSTIDQRFYQCPRCGRQTKYKEKSALASAPTDGSPHFQELA